MERIRILHRLRVYSTYVRKQCKTRIRFFVCKIRINANFRVGFVRIRSVFSDSFGFVPTCRILWGPGFMRFFCPLAGATPAVFDDLRFLILFFLHMLRTALFSGVPFGGSNTCCIFAFVLDTMQLRFFHWRGWQPATVKKAQWGHPRGFR